MKQKHIRSVGILGGILIAMVGGYIVWSNTFHLSFIIIIPSLIVGNIVLFIAAEDVRNNEPTLL